MRRRFTVHFSWAIALTTALVAPPNPLQAMADEDKTTEGGTLSTEVETRPTEECQKLGLPLKIQSSRYPR